MMVLLLLLKMMKMMFFNYCHNVTIIIVMAWTGPENV